MTELTPAELAATDALRTFVRGQEYTDEWIADLSARAARAALAAARPAIEAEVRADMGAALAAGTLSDGYHTHNELYEYRLLYHAHAARGWVAAGVPVVRSRRHHDGEEPFGGGWFIVVAELPTGQISNHYRLADWALFDGVPEVPLAPVWDRHTPTEAAERLRAALLGGDDRG